VNREPSVRETDPPRHTRLRPVRKNPCRNRARTGSRRPATSRFTAAAVCFGAVVIYRQ
jgi:hypothetical protein